MNIRNIGFKNCCERYAKANKKNKDLFAFFDSLEKITSYYFYKRLRNDKISLDALRDKWHYSVPRSLKNYDDDLVNHLENIIKTYKNTNVKCVSNPIHLEICGVNLEGQVDVVSENNGIYTLHYFKYNTISDYDSGYENKIIPLIMSISFVNDFKKHDYNISMHNTMINKRTTYPGNTNVEQLKDLLNKSKISCKDCDAKKTCKYSKP